MVGKDIRPASRRAIKPPADSSWGAVKDLGYRLPDGKYTQLRRVCKQAGVKSPARYCSAFCTKCNTWHDILVTNINTGKTLRCQDCAKVLRTPDKKKRQLKKGSPEENAAVLALIRKCEQIEAGDLDLFETLAKAFKDAGFPRVPYSDRHKALVNRVRPLTVTFKEKQKVEAKEKEEEERERQIKIVPVLKRPLTWAEYWEYRTGRAC